MVEARKSRSLRKRVAVVALAAVVAVLAAPPAGVPSVSRLVIDTFEQGELSGWIERQYSGRTLYQVVSEGENRLVRADSRASASALGKIVSFDPRRFAHLEWRWKIEDIIEAGSDLEAETKDHPAGVYVIFSRGLVPWRVEVIQYIWANALAQGAVASHPTEENIRIVAVEGGRARARRWIRERRNLADDYRELFGDEPPKVIAIAIMTDTDQTKSQATAYYDDLIVRR
jgi:hypothetical protein